MKPQPFFASKPKKLLKLLVIFLTLLGYPLPSFSPPFRCCSHSQSLEACLRKSGPSPVGVGDAVAASGAQM